MPRPAQERLDALYRQLQDEPSHGPGEFRYPRARARKVAEVPPGETVDGILGGAAPGGGTLISRTWGWLVGANVVNTRTTVVSPGFTTPLMLYELIYSWPETATNQGGLTVLYSSDNSGAQTGGSVTPKPSGTPVLQRGDARSTTIVDADDIPEHLPMVGIGATAGMPVHLHPRFIVDSGGTVYFKVSFRNTNGSDNRVRGVLVIYEAGSVAELLAIG